VTGPLFLLIVVGLALVVLAGATRPRPVERTDRMDVGTRVALIASGDFTGTVDRIEGDLFTVKFDVGGRGWLRADQLTEIEPALETEGTPS
jgi:dissimilatory sulfite reductase (desulfoviridin) alpha/beta subunit